MAANAALISQLTDHSSGWDWENKNVSQSYTNADKQQINAISDIIESGTTLIAAGPASLDMPVDTTDNVARRIVPIGMVETAAIAMSKPLSRIFEIGSRLSYLIPGRTVGQITLARVLFDGPSLLKMLYKGEVLSDHSVDEKKYAEFASGVSFSTINNRPASAIGSGNIAMNLASKFFDQPFGLCFFFRDMQDQSVGTMYFEGCKVGSYNIGIQAGMNVLTEGVAIEFVRCRPVAVGTSVTATWSTPQNESTSVADVAIVGTGAGA